MSQTSSTAQRGSLPDSWISKIFEQMSCTYGSKFSDMWRDQDPEKVRSFWAYKLGGFADNPEAIKHALSSLDSRPFPPTLPEFIELCRSAASRLPSAPALPAPAPDDEKVRAKTEEIGRKFGDPFAPSLEWARKLKKRFMAGEHLVPIQISMASEALNETSAMWRAAMKG